ncbi:hypothetical protein BDD12DRAFT_21401 [Trichophaea hybrida]|nr:hypothetical protein BDD12DRAFT_21401 [Trichophaea hybrida]
MLPVIERFQALPTDIASADIIPLLLIPKTEQRKPLAQASSAHSAAESQSPTYGRLQSFALRRFGVGLLRHIAKPPSWRIYVCIADWGIINRPKIYPASFITTVMKWRWETSFVIRPGCVPAQSTTTRYLEIECSRCIWRCSLPCMQRLGVSHSKPRMSLTCSWLRFRRSGVLVLIIIFTATIWPYYLVSLDVDAHW